MGAFSAHVGNVLLLQHAAITPSPGYPSVAHVYSAMQYALLTACVSARWINWSAKIESPSSVMPAARAVSVKYRRMPDEYPSASAR